MIKPNHNRLYYSSFEENYVQNLAVYCEYELKKKVLKSIKKLPGWDYIEKNYHLKVYLNHSRKTLVTLTA